MALFLVTALGEKPVSLSEARLHLRVDSEDENTLIESLIEAATDAAQSFTRRAFVTQTYDWKCDGFGCNEIPMAPLISVTSISYKDSNGTVQTWATSEYIVSAPAGPLAQPGRVALAYGVSYPSTQEVIDAVTIRFVAGYGDADDVPSAIKSAILLIVGNLYANRESVVITGRGQAAAEMPQSALWLLWPYRVINWG